jgi:hypothetical protein
MRRNDNLSSFRTNLCLPGSRSPVTCGTTTTLNPEKASTAARPVPPRVLAITISMTPSSSARALTAVNVSSVFFSPGPEKYKIDFRQDICITIPQDIDNYLYQLFYERVYQPITSCSGNYLKENNEIEMEFENLDIFIVLTLL